MFYGHEAPGILQCPVLETAVTSDEIQHLVASFLQQSDGSTVVSQNSSLDDWLNQGAGLVDSGSMSMDEERKRKRKVSNRASARRSRWRKKRHLEDLNALSNRFTNENRELKNQLGFVVNQCHLVRRQNEQLRFESVALWTKLTNLIRIFEAMQ